MNWVFPILRDFAARQSYQEANFCGTPDSTNHLRLAGGYSANWANIRTQARRPCRKLDKLYFSFGE